MKISVNIELSNVEELNQIAEAFKANGIEVGDLEVSTTVKETATPKAAAPAKAKKGKAAKVEAEEMEDVPSPFVNTPAPAQSLVESPALAVPPVINQAPAQQAPVQQYATQAPVQNAAPAFNALSVIQEAAGRLGAFPGLDQSQKQDVIASTLQQVGAPQGVRGSELPEPHLSRFAQALKQKVDQITTPAQGLV